MAMATAFETSIHSMAASVRSQGVIGRDYRRRMFSVSFRPLGPHFECLATDRCPIWDRGFEKSFCCFEALSIRIPIGWASRNRSTPGHSRKQHSHCECLYGANPLCGDITAKKMGASASGNAPHAVITASAVLPLLRDIRTWITHSDLSMQPPLIVVFEADLV